MKYFLGFYFLVFFSSCALFNNSDASKAQGQGTLKAVKMTRKEPAASCEAVGAVRGTYLGLKPNLKKALEDLKIKGYEKGGNYIRVDASSEGDTAVSGMAFKCP